MLVIHHSLYPKKTRVRAIGWFSCDQQYSDINVILFGLVFYWLCVRRLRSALSSAEVGQGILGQCYGVFQVTERRWIYSNSHARCHQPEEGLSEYLVQ